MRKSIGGFEGVLKSLPWGRGQGPGKRLRLYALYVQFKVISCYPTIIRDFKKDHFCIYKYNRTKHFDTQDEILNFQ